MKTILKFLLILYATQFFPSCKNKDSDAKTAETDIAPQSRTPVTVTSVNYAPLQDFIELNATSVYLQKTTIKSNLNGYIKSSNIKYASMAKAGQVLFTLITKESNAIGNSINSLDPNFKFSGINYIKASLSGYVSELDHQTGDYVQDGEQLAVITNLNSFVFVMNVPYEYRQYVSNNKAVELVLPGDERIKGNIQTSMPFMDSVSQTQEVAIKVNTSQQIPQNLVAKVRILKTSKSAAASLPATAILSDETHTEFWVMKLMNDSTAVKVPVKKGIETDGKIEIVSPEFNPKEKIIISGNYGLPDTASIRIETP